MFHTGIVEDINDPLEIGRARVRVIGIHSIDVNEIPTEALPWATVLMPTTSASAEGVGMTPKFRPYKSWVMVYFLDGEDMQQPVIMGTLPGISATTKVVINGTPMSYRDAQEIPDSEYLNQSDLPQNARSGATPNLRESVQINNIAGAFSEPPDLRPFRQYPYSQVRQSLSGHVEEWDDTPENERISTQHKSGTFVEMRPDGDNVTKVMKDNYTIVAGDNNLYVKGSVNILVEGDVNLTTEGDYNINVGGDYNLRVQGNTFHHTNEDVTEVVNGSKSSYIVNNETTTIGVDRTETIVGSETKSIYKDKTETILGSQTSNIYTDKTTNVDGNVSTNILGNKSVTTKGNVSESVTGTLGLNAKSSVSLLSQSNIEVGSTSPVYVRGSTVDLNDSGASTFSFNDVEKQEEVEEIEVYDQDFESIEADISLNQTSPTIKSTQVGTVDSDAYKKAVSSSYFYQPSTQGAQLRALNGKSSSSSSTTAPTFFPGSGRQKTDYNNVEYNYSSGTKRDGKVDNSLESILSQAAYQSGVFMVEIYSGLQPGSAGRRTGSGRHDTGFAVDVRLIKTKEDYENVKGIQYVNGTTSEGRGIFTQFIQAGVKLGLRGGGFSPGYMGAYGMHLDTLGQIINTRNSRSPSGYDRDVLAVWKSTNWFKQAFYSADPNYKYFITLASGTSYYSKNNTKWNTLA